MKRLVLGLSAAAALAVNCARAAEIDNPFDDWAAKSAERDLAKILAGRPVKIRFRVDPSMPAQAWRLKASRGVLDITGRDGLGIAYGAYSFLESIGCRWYAPDVSRIPDLSGWKLEDMEKAGRPAIMGRWMYPGSDIFPVEWVFRNKGTTGAGQGDTWKFGSPGPHHTFPAYARAITNKCPDKVGATWFCLTDPGVRGAVAEEMKRLIRADREKSSGGSPYSRPVVYDLSQDDGGMGYPCRCKDCAELKAAAGSWSGPNVAFVDAVASEVAGEFPDVIVRTFGYSYTELPPTNGMTAGANLAVRYCRSFLFQPLTGETDNGRILRKWNDCVPGKSIWSYWRSFSGPLFPTVKNRADIADEMRFCREMNVLDYFAQSETPSARAFSMLQSWLFLKFSENPDLDMGALSGEFIRAYYGAAAGTMEKYLSYLERRQKDLYAKIDPAFLRSVTSGYLAMYVQRGYLDREFFATVLPLLEQAESLVRENALHLSHVRRERLVVDRAFIDEYRAAEASPKLVRAAAERIAANCAALTEAWGFKGDAREKHLRRAADEAARLGAFAVRCPIPAPPELAGRDFVEWSVARLGDNALGLKQGLEFVPDASSASGGAVCVKGEKKRVPFPASLQDDWTGKWDKARGVEIPEDGKYHLVKIGTIPLVAESGIWLGDMLAWIPPLAPKPEKREFWISVKSEASRYLYDRLFIVKPLKGTDK